MRACRVQQRRAMSFSLKFSLCLLCLGALSACDDDEAKGGEGGGEGGAAPTVMGGQPAGSASAGAEQSGEEGSSGGAELAGAPEGASEVGGSAAGLGAGGAPEPEPEPWLEEAAQLARDGQLTLTREPQPRGDPEEGLRYLLYGDYVAGGIPYETYMRFIGPIPENELMREGDSAELPPGFNAFTLNGARVVGGITCLGCHSSYINGQLVLGLGNSFSNFAASPPEWLTGLLENFVRNTYGEESPEWAAFVEFSRGSARIAPYARSPFQGVNPAFIIEAAASASRDPNTFAWQEEPSYPLEPFAEGISSDVPAWWNVKKKAALYYNGMGRGRFSKMLMQISVVAIRDAEQAAQIHSHFADLLAWIDELEPPPFPAELDVALATQGRAVFQERCARCHGSYRASFEDEGEEERYPNLLISLDQVGTDPAYALQMSERPELSQWINRGWYGRELEDPRAEAQGLGPAQMKAFPLEGYVAPPLDGVWVTAPYLHNGSVPTLAALLDSATRPERWRRDFESSEYDLTAVGWPHEVVEEGLELEDPTVVYDTTITGYGRQGHTFGDQLSPEERAALLEYLKSI